ncbi:peptidase T [Photobacterium indicum]|uniref:peptidase T n=1 Tax=Photobacterium indicum TaxID=81447 RepID=UPI003D1198A7
MQRIKTLQITDTFLNYTKINTTAVPSATHLPSSANQHILAQIVAKDLMAVGCTDIDIQSNAITTIRLDANKEGLPSIVFFAHLDTAPDHVGDTKAKVVKNYQCNSISFKGTTDTLSVVDNPELLNYVGQDIIITDGTSLLGADDKAAIAASVEAIKYMVEHPEFKHGVITLVLLPDEEIGIRGAKALDVKALKADFGICLDCCGIGEYVVENWYASEAIMTFSGVTAHPMSAKGNLINALIMANDVINQLPVMERPEHTENRQGYFWPHKLAGDTASAKLEIAIRDFDENAFNNRKMMLNTIAASMNDKYGTEHVKIEQSDTYGNVKTGLDKQPEILRYVEQAMDNLDIPPKPLTMRGGYDGSVITPKGLTTVNIFTGAHNFHSVREFLPCESLRMASEMLLEIVSLSAKGDGNE